MNFRMDFRRLVLLLCLLVQTFLLVYSNHVRTGMLKTMRDQNNALEQADKALKQSIQTMDFQGRVIDDQARAIKQLRRECGTTQDRIVYR